MAEARVGVAREAVERAEAREEARAGAARAGVETGAVAPAERMAHPEGAMAPVTPAEAAGSEGAATATRAPRVAGEGAMGVAAMGVASAAWRVGLAGEVCQVEREGLPAAVVARAAEEAMEEASTGRQPRKEGHPRLPVPESLSRRLKVESRRPHWCQ
jgi:hypothetical protein